MSEDAEPGPWAIWRQDDHGNRFLIEVVAGEEEARARVAALASLGHKQIYWCEPRADDAQPDRRGERSPPSP